MADVKLAASILSSDFTRLGEQVQEAIEAGVDFVHVDVMDGHFVPNLTIGPPIVRALRPIVPDHVTFDVHLMVERPEQIIPAFVEARPDILTVHVEACKHLHRVVQQIREHGVGPGVALNPATPLAAIEEILPYVDLALVMSVNPGFGGQSYIPTSTPKIARLRTMLDASGSTAYLEVDGGVNPGNVKEIADAGVTVIVSGSSIFNDEESVAQNVEAFRVALG